MSKYLEGFLKLSVEEQNNIKRILENPRLLMRMFGLEIEEVTGEGN